MKRLLVIAAALIALGLSAVWAAPTRPTAQSLPDELQGIANISRIHLTVSAIPKAAYDVGIRGQDILDQARDKLIDAGFDVAQDKNVTPRITYSIEVLSDPQLPDTYGYVVFIDIYQQARIVRLNKQLLLPTTTLLVHGIKKSQDLAAAIQAQTMRVTDQFISIEKIASAAR